MLFTFGSDAEFFLMMNGNFQSAIPVIGSSRNERIKLNGHEFFYDNVLAECAIKPGKSKEEVIENIRECLRYFSDMVKPYELCDLASAIFPKEQLRHPHAIEAGCDPEICAYMLEEAVPSDSFMTKTNTGMYVHTTNFRTTGGHIHLGCDSGPLQDVLERPIVIYMLDLFLGIPSILTDFDQTSKARKAIYGKAGRYRNKEYGVEYRTLSPFWLSSPRKVGVIWELCNFVLQFVAEGNYKKFWTVENIEDPVYSCYGYDAAILQSTINTCDREQAEKFMTFIENYLPKEVIKGIKNMTTYGWADDLYEEWGL